MLFLLWANKIQGFFKELPAVSKSTFVLSLSGCKYTRVFRSRNTKNKVFFGFFHI